MRGRSPGWSRATTTKLGRVFFTLSKISDSSSTSPTISMSGWSAKVERIVSRIKRGRFATRTRIDFSMAHSLQCEVSMQVSRQRKNQKLPIYFDLIELVLDTSEGW